MENIDQMRRYVKIFGDIIYTRLISLSLGINLERTHGPDGAMFVPFIITDKHLVVDIQIVLF